MASIINATTTAGVAVTGDNSGALALQTNNGTTAVTINTSQNVGIGTTTPVSKLDVFADTVTFGDTGSFNFAINGTNVLFKNGAGGATECMRITSGGDLRFNSGYGSVATAYGCRAWVNFNGTGTVAIRASANVSSITDVGVGQYTVNLTNSMPDANYSVGVNTDYDGVGFGVNAKNFATGSFSVQCILPNLSNYTDHSLVNCQVFR
jgi:hypothetical protein